MEEVEFCICNEGLGNGKEMVGESDGFCIRCKKPRRLEGDGAPGQEAEGVVGARVPPVTHDDVGEEIHLEKVLNGSVLTVEEKDGSKGSILVIKVDLKKCSETTEGMDQFAGFMLRWQQTGINLMVAFQAKHQANQLVRPGFRPGFLDKLKRGFSK